MFDGSDYPASLDEGAFDEWLENGRNSLLSYKYLIIVWSDMDRSYSPVYVEDRKAFSQYDHYGDSVSQESLVAVYDLYSESRVLNY